MGEDKARCPCCGSSDPRERGTLCYPWFEADDFHKENDAPGTRQPQTGEKWCFLDTGEEFWITNLGKDYAHLTSADDGAEMPPMPTMYFLDGVRQGLWEYRQFSEAICPKCNVNLKAEGDYLCDTCRYG